MAEEMVSDVGPSHIRMAKMVGSAGFEFDEAGVSDRAGRFWELHSLRIPAGAIPGAELVVYPGMGHSLPPALWPDFASRIAALIWPRESRSAEVRGTADGNANSRMGA
jgi:hypothetical protein